MVDAPTPSHQVGVERPRLGENIVRAVQRVEQLASGPAREQVRRHTAHSHARHLRGLGVCVKRQPIRSRLAIGASNAD